MQVRTILAHFPAKRMQSQQNERQSGDGGSLESNHANSARAVLLESERATGQNALEFPGGGILQQARGAF
jgi:hypothetical protein